MWSAGIDNHFVGDPCFVQFIIKLAHLVCRDTRIVSAEKTQHRIFTVPRFFEHGGIGAAKLPAHSGIEANNTSQVQPLFGAGQKRESPSHAEAKCELRTSSTLT